MAQIHGCRAGMIGHAGNGDVPLQYAYYTADHPNLDLIPLQKSTLLDVQFQKGSQISFLAYGILNVVRISTDGLDAIVKGKSALTHRLQNFLSQVAGHEATAVGRSFLV